MSDFESTDAFQAAMDRIDAIARAATAASTVSATVETDLVTVTMTAAPLVELLDYSREAFRGHGSEALAEATRAAIAEAVVAVQAAQAEQLQASPELATLVQPGSMHGAELPPEMAERARLAAAELAAAEFTAADPEARVEVSVDGAGAITRLWLSATAGRESSAEWLGESVRETVNAALGQARRAQEGLLGGEQGTDLEAELEAIVGAFESRLGALDARLDDVNRRLGLD